MFKAASEKRIREHNDRMHLAWFTARLTAYAPRKSSQFVKLDALMHKAESGVKRQTADQQIAVLKGILAKKKR